MANTQYAFLAFAFLQDGVADIGGMSLSIPAMSRLQLLVELVTIRVSQSASVDLLGLLLLLGVCLTRRRPGRIAKNLLP